MKTPTIIAEWVDGRKTDIDQGAKYRMTREQYDQLYAIYRQTFDAFGNESWQLVGQASYSDSNIEDILAGAVDALAARMRGSP